MANRLNLERRTAPDYPLTHNDRELKLAETIREDKNIEDTFDQAPVFSNTDNQSGSPLPTEAAAGAEIAFNSGKHPYELHLAAVESTGTAVYLHPYTSADGLEIPLDANVTDGPTAVEITNGITSRSKAAQVIGSNLKPGERFFMEAEIKIDDVSDLEELFCGFRKAEAYQADPDSYDEMAAFHIGETGGTVADGQVNIATILNNAATSYTDTTEADWADGETHTLRVEVDWEGRCYFKYDGAEPAVTKAFTFDAGEVVIPFLYVDNTSGSSTGDPGVTLVSYKCGKL